MLLSAEYKLELRILKLYTDTDSTNTLTPEM